MTRLGLFDRRFVLGAHIAALDPKASRSVDADEDAGAGDLLRGIDDRTILDRFERRLDLGETRVDFLGDFVRFRIGRFELIGFETKRLAGRGFLFAQRLAFALKMAKPIGVAIGKVDRHLDPFPALRPNGLGVARELLGDQPFEQRDILEPAAVVALEEVAHDGTAGGQIVFGRHTARACRRPGPRLR